MKPHLWLYLFASLTLRAKSATLSQPTFFQAMCDASAAVALDNDSFAVANDEDNPIRIYAAEKGGLPTQSFDFSSQLRVDPKKPEMDLEGACWLKDKIFWITSHGRNKQGEYRPSRQFLFATTCRKTAKGWDLKLAGRPYQNLLADLTRNTRFDAFHLDQASRLPPKAPGGLNIEAVCATPDHKLLIGFRNPIPGGKSLIVTLENPEQVIAGAPAKLGEPILLSLGGLGIRDIEFCEGQYLIIGGSSGAQHGSHLYRWKGGSESPEPLDWSKSVNFNPEALIVYPNRRPIQLLSDDGTRRIGSQPCKEIKDPAQRRFRGYWVSLSE
jgi:hypothetical protein